MKSILKFDLIKPDNGTVFSDLNSVYINGTFNYVLLHNFLLDKNNELRNMDADEQFPFGCNTISLEMWEDSDDDGAFYVMKLFLNLRIIKVKE